MARIWKVLIMAISGQNRHTRKVDNLYHNKRPNHDSRNGLNLNLDFDEESKHYDQGSQNILDTSDLKKRELKRLKMIFESKGDDKNNDNINSNLKSHRIMSKKSKKKSERAKVLVENTESDEDSDIDITPHKRKSKKGKKKKSKKSRRYKSDSSSKSSESSSSNDYPNFKFMQPANMLQSFMKPQFIPQQNSLDKCKQYREYYRSSFFPLKNDQLKDLMNQIDIYIQAVIQTLLMAKDVNQQYQLYVLLYNFTKSKETILKPLKLPKFEIPWVKPEGDSEPLKIQPQVSFYQSPILEYAHKIVNKIGKINSPAELNEYLLQYQPLIQPYMLPEAVKPEIKNRRKFCSTDDKFLLQGLKEFGSKDITNIRNFCLPDKKESEIKHRYK